MIVASISEKMHGIGIQCYFDVHVSFLCLFFLVGCHDPFPQPARNMHAITMAAVTAESSIIHFIKGPKYSELHKVP